MANLFSAGTPYIYNVTLTAADTEYSQQLPAGCKRFAVSIQGGQATTNFRVAFVTGKVATPTAPYLKLSGDMEYWESDINTINPLAVYVASSNAGDVAQIVAWV